MSDLHLAVVGVGCQGRTLIDACLAIPGVRVSAVCDIWPYHLESALDHLRRRGQEPRGYAEFDDLVADEKDLHAVIIATPDGCHADQTVACLKAGLHVYCEAEMAGTLAGCRRMVLAARQSGRLLQIGRQKRSSPHYRQALEQIEQAGSVGRIGHVSGRWHGRLLAPPVPDGREVPERVLDRHGYGSMDALVNWRHSPDFSAGPLASLGNHQIDVFHWFLRGPPRAVDALGNSSACPAVRHRAALCLLEWEYVQAGVPSAVRGDYHVLTVVGPAEANETVMGDEGIVLTAEDPSYGGLAREEYSAVSQWERENSRFIYNVSVGPPAGFEQCYVRIGRSGRVYYTRRVYPWKAAAEGKSAHRLHLENFFDAIRGSAKLTSSAEIAYPASVTIFRAIESMRTRRRVTMTPDEFVV